VTLLGKYFAHNSQTPLEMSIYRRRQDISLNSQGSRGTIDPDTAPRRASVKYTSEDTRNIPNTMPSFYLSNSKKSSKTRSTGEAHSSRSSQVPKSYGGRIRKSPDREIPPKSRSKRTPEKKEKARPVSSSEGSSYSFSVEASTEEDRKSGYSEDDNEASLEYQPVSMKTTSRGVLQQHRTNPPKVKEKQVEHKKNPRVKSAPYPIKSKKKEKENNILMISSESESESEESSEKEELDVDKSGRKDQFVKQRPENIEKEPDIPVRSNSAPKPHKRIDESTPSFIAAKEAEQQASPAPKPKKEKRKLPQMPKLPFITKKDKEKNSPKIKEKSSPKVKEKTSPKIKEKSSPKVKPKSSPKVKPKSSPKDKPKSSPKDKPKKKPNQGKKAKANTPEPQLMFGIPLENTILNSEGKPVHEIPPVVKDCIQQLQLRHAEEEEGIFRISGSAKLIEEYKKKYNRGEKVDLSQLRDPHGVAGLLKLFFRQLPQSIFNTKHAFSLSGADVNAQALCSAIMKLPEVNQKTLQRVVSFLVKVALCSGKNKMTVDNLSIIFAPAFKLDNDLSKILILHYDEIFEGKQKDQTTENRKSRKVEHIEEENEQNGNNDTDVSAEQPGEDEEESA